MSNTLHERLKAATRETHDRLDQRIMAGDIFANTDNFARFLRVQARFHADIAALYDKPELSALIPDLDERRRLTLIAQDLADLGAPAPAHVGKLDGNTPLPEALGWLYVAEGSNVGGAVLFKLASKQLGLSAEHGARHLASHPDGAARHWRAFTQALNEAGLDETSEAHIIAAANQAFATVHGYVAEEFA